jgi:hypothetical protein
LFWFAIGVVGVGGREGGLPLSEEESPLKKEKREMEKEEEKEVS